MADDLKDKIKENAEGPNQASADGVSTQQPPPPADQIGAGRDGAASPGVAKVLVDLDRGGAGGAIIPAKSPGPSSNCGQTDSKKENLR